MVKTDTVGLRQDVLPSTRPTNTLNNADICTVLRSKLSICCQVSCVCLIQQREGSPLQNINEGTGLQTANLMTTCSLHPKMFVCATFSNHDLTVKITIIKNQQKMTYRQTFYVEKQRCLSVRDSFHQPESQSPVYSVDQICPPFLECNMCFPEDRHEDVHLQNRENDAFIYIAQ